MNAFSRNAKKKCFTWNIWMKCKQQQKKNIEKLWLQFQFGNIFTWWKSIYELIAMIMCHDNNCDIFATQWKIIAITFFYRFEWNSHSIELNWTINFRSSWQKKNWYWKTSTKWIFIGKHYDLRKTNKFAIFCVRNRFWNIRRLVSNTITHL